MGSTVLRYVQATVKLVFRKRNAQDVTEENGYLGLNVKKLAVLSAVEMEAVIKTVDIVYMDVKRDGGVTNVCGVVTADQMEHAISLEGAQAVHLNNMVSVDLADRVTVVEMETASIMVHVSVL